MLEYLQSKIVLVSITIKSFSGYKRATAEHIQRMGGHLPASKAITEGSIKIFPEDHLKPLTAVRRTVLRKLQSLGIKALNASNVIAIHADDLPAAEKLINEAKGDFDVALDDFVKNYETNFEAHAKANPEAADIIRSLKKDVTDASASFKFFYQFFTIQPKPTQGESEEDSVEALISQLGGQLYEEIAEGVRKVFTSKAIQLQRVNQRTMNYFHGLASKMEKMQFLDPSLEGAVKLAKDILGSLPSEGIISGNDFLTFFKLAEIMSDAEDFLNAASKVRKGTPPCDVIFPPSKASIAPVTQSEMKNETDTLQVSIPGFNHSQGFVLPGTDTTSVLPETQLIIPPRASTKVPVQGMCF